MYLVYRQLVYVYINAHCYHKWTNECICVGALLLCCLALFGDYLCARLERYWENVVGCDCCSIQYICCWMFGVVCGCARLRQELPLFQLISQQYTLFQLSCARARTRNTREREQERSFRSSPIENQWQKRTMNKDEQENMNKVILFVCVPQRDSKRKETELSIERLKRIE